MISGIISPWLPWDCMASMPSACLHMFTLHAQQAPYSLSRVRMQLLHSLHSTHEGAMQRRGWRRVKDRRLVRLAMFEHLWCNGENQVHVQVRIALAPTCTCSSRSRHNCCSISCNMPPQSKVGTMDMGPSVLHEGGCPRSPSGGSRPPGSLMHLELPLLAHQFQLLPHGDLEDLLDLQCRTQCVLLCSPSPSCIAHNHFSRS